jgi:hypothetical protein
MDLSGRSSTVDDPMHRCPADAERAGNVAWSPIIRRHRFDREQTSNAVREEIEVEG